MKAFAGFVVILALLLGFSWFAWDKIETNANYKLQQQIEQLEQQVEAANGAKDRWKDKFQAVKELTKDTSSNDVKSEEAVDITP